MKVTFANERPDGSYALAIPLRSDEKLGERLNWLNETERGLVVDAVAAQRFKGEIGSIAEAFVRDAGKVRRLLVVGLGARQDEDMLFERAGSALSARLLTSGETRLVVDLAGIDAKDAAARLAFGASARAWRYDRYRTKLSDKAKPTLSELVVVAGGEQGGAEWRDKEALLGGLDLARELVTEPANIIYPESFVERCRASMQGLDIEFELLDENAMRELGMGALLGVGQGSVRPPRLLAMRWNGGEAGGKPVVFVGKGVTFDTGGISIKPAAGMEAMKWDMGGAAAVAGAMRTLAARGAKANVVGVCGLVENMPDGNAQRPGDVVTSMSGQTIEVINTDAEGRLVLCDAITWAQRQYQPEVLVDLATLTGAMIVSLGFEYAGLFANDDGLAQQLSDAGARSGDRLWRMPLGDAYNKLMDSPIADVKNAGPREAGSITAACYIQRFVDEGVKWAHLDVAGMVWANKPGTLFDKGATGYGVALLDRFVADYYEA
jgi:leucyl aminopeptidase